MVPFNDGVLNVAPTKATDVSVASVYQVNIGLVTVVVLATNAAEVPWQMLASFAETSATLAIGVTVSATAKAPPDAFSHLLSPLTVT